MSLRTDRVRVVAFVKKNDDISQEEFRRYWVEDRAKVFPTIGIVERNLLKYEQMIRDHAVVKDLEARAPGYSPPHWDALALFEAESFEKIFAIFQDEEYKKIIIQAELEFVDRKGSTMLPLDFATILELS